MCKAPIVFCPPYISNCPPALLDPPVEIRDLFSNSDCGLSLLTQEAQEDHTLDEEGKREEDHVINLHRRIMGLIFLIEIHHKAN